MSPSRPRPPDIKIHLRLSTLNFLNKRLHPLTCTVVLELDELLGNAIFCDIADTKEPILATAPLVPSGAPRHIVTERDRPWRAKRAPRAAEYQFEGRGFDSEH
ncbi:hypothetical protein EVAR_37653_1 [Eumeta japonica]|uniref:Uncharacterized protein n=1 Tax=Eumeta variegata TaxID=151549 RepID=A0A4C1VNL2_EUMVA|nr:hypothetical protein EVAR_37653_1 [Eumeta japonica]